MITRVLAAGLAAGLVAGLAVAALQHVTTTPLILAAEVYETAQHGHEHVADAAAFEGARRTFDHAASGRDRPDADNVTEHEYSERASSEKPVSTFSQRALATSVATITVNIGYALILLAAMLLANDRIDPRRALLWGAGAFAATGLATSLGLAPQLPGAAETDLAFRQIWWIATACSTAAGLYALTRREGALAIAIGIVLIIAPHFFWPAPATPESTVPAELAARFAASSLAVQAASWALAGALAGLVWRMLSRQEETS